MDNQILQILDTFKGRFNIMSMKQIRYTLNIELRRRRLTNEQEYLRNMTDKELFNLVSIDNEVVKCGRNKGEVKIKFRRVNNGNNK